MQKTFLINQLKIISELIVTGQGCDYRTVCLLDYNYFKEYYEMMAIDLSKQKQYNKLILQKI